MLKSNKAPSSICVVIIPSNLRLLYTIAYADKAEAENDPKKNLFNCAQRVHQVSVVSTDKKYA